MITKKHLENFQNEIQFNFKKKDNLLKALIHPSFIQDKKLIKVNLINEFERLEFLGDRVLGIVISFLIFDKYKNFNEGSLTKKLSYLVQKDFLYKIAIEIKIDKILKYSHKKNNIRMNTSILSDSVESLIGSIYIDSGYNSAFKFIKRIWGPYLGLEASNEQDSKTKLQEISQHKYKTLPEYKLIKKEGPSHSPVFTVSLKVLKLKLIKATGQSKKEAEKNAAKIALNIFDEKKIN
tara:strand:- start:189 stop:896 length:708 start_codon:yes stop_codon:yes gene_type:complete